MRIIRWIIPWLFLPGLAFGGVWDSTYEGAAGTHAVITDSTVPSTIDDHARNERQQVRKRMAVEHFMGDGDGGANDDNGLHRLGSGRCYMQASAPTTLSDSHSLVTIADYLNSSETAFGGETGLEDGASNSADKAEDDVGHGRCWIDTDDNFKLYFYQGVDGDNTPSAVADGWKPIGGNGSNLVFHGSFDGTDGDGDNGALVVPYGWTVKGSTPDFSYVDVLVSEGAGLAVKTIANGTADQGLTQTFNNLRASAGYRASVRVLPNSGDICQLLITGSDRTAPTGGEVETSTTGSYVTLNIDFFTDSTPTAIILILQSKSDGDICTWDNATLEPFTGSSSPGAVVYLATSNSDQACDNDYTGTCKDLVTIEVRPPGPGYYIWISGTASFNVANTAVCNLEIEETVGTTQLAERQIGSGTSTGTDLPIQYISITPLQADTLQVYTLNAKETTANCIVKGTQTVTRIQAILIPSGR